MGACDFTNVKKGCYKNAQEAFIEAVKDAQYMHGHGGYTGTIAEKHSFIMIDLPKRKNPYDFIDQCLNGEIENVELGKWGPAGCIEITGAELKKARGERYKGKRGFKCYLFFGIASE